ncbi:hypothetical protein H0E84_15710 [Luteimonas sp. SJ-92]|uniref:Uncharacterized protein n=1 Tax=Luteimonas salinisoli TaxID=2752307 RepID=A0A853JGF5_9GAMM|nr:hypothetical protein [Luteimonas salinisoli]NZA27824.1 hypothetical protein [Luteimonas salinisoli]
MRKDPANDRSLSAILVVGVHLALGWWLLTQAPPEPRRAAETALRIHWIVPPPAPAPEPEPPPTPADTARIAPPSRTMTVVEPPPAQRPDADDAAMPSAHALLEQGRRWAGSQAGDHDFRRDPLRPAAPQARAPERFRMTPPPSPAQVLESIGQMVNGPGYEADPCPRVRRNLAGLAPGGDSELLQEEIRRLRRLCQ